MTQKIFNPKMELIYNSDDMEYDTTKSIYHDMASMLLNIHSSKEPEYKIVDAKKDYLKIINCNGWIVEFTDITF